MATTVGLGLAIWVQRRLTLGLAMMGIWPIIAGRKDPGWKGRGSQQEEGVHQKVHVKKKPVKKSTKKEIETVAVMFVDQTVGAMLAKRLQTAEDAILQ